jgi:hypothetical protein
MLKVNVQSEKLFKIYFKILKILQKIHIICDNSIKILMHLCM